MLEYLKRLARTSVAYQASDLLSKAIAVGTLPLYTRYLAPGDYGVAETLLTGVILWSIVLRAGLGEGFVRFYYDDADPERRRRLARAVTGFVALTTTVAALLGGLLAGPLSSLILGYRDATVLVIAVVGLWTFTNLEIAYALLRVDERARAYVTATITNVLVTVSLTIVLVVVGGYGARGLLAGNFAGSTVVLLGVWAFERDRVGLRLDRAPLRALLAFGLPTIPADAGVYALNVIDRAFLFRTQSHAAAGFYALAVKLATVVTVTVRGFQYAWPPLAYSVTDDADAARLYAVVATYYVLVTGTVVAGVTLLGRWGVRALAAPAFYPAHSALPWLALGWALYGLFLVLVVTAGRVRVTTRNFPAALAGLIVNVVALVVLVPGLGIAGAGIALCAAYVVMVVVLYGLTRRLFVVRFEWGRLGLLVGVLALVAVTGELLLPTSGLGGFALRALAWCLILPLLIAGRFFRPREVARLRELVGRARMLRAPEAG